jgi:sterol desaturase/sphingolipid hydroxylase (fatty acid hydroxylase superfamily)
VHAHNYADVPLWDIVFGTFRNPDRDAPQPLQGFYEGASARVAEMLAFRDIAGPKAAPRGEISEA